MLKIKKKELEQYGYRHPIRIYKCTKVKSVMGKKQKENTDNISKTEYNVHLAVTPSKILFLTFRMHLHVPA